MADSNNTLTSFLTSGTRWSGKQSFYFLVITLLIGGGMISFADPSLDHISLTADVPTHMGQKYLNGNDPMQFGITVVDGHGKVNLQIYRVQFKVTENNQTSYYDSHQDNSEEVLEEVFSMTGSEYLEERSFESGTYYFIATADNDVGILFTQAEFNHGAFFLLIVFIILFSIAQAIFWTLLPFTIFVLLVNAMNPNKTPVAPIHRTNVRNGTTRRVHTPRRHRAQAPMFSQGSFFNKLTNSDWGWLSAGVFSFVMFFIVPDGPFFAFAVIIFIAIFYGVTEREKMKDRLVILLEHYPETSVDFLASQLGKKKKKDVVKVLQIMILDENLPLQLNLHNNRVSRVGTISKDYTMNNRQAMVHTSPTPIQTASVQTTPIQPPVQTTPTQAAPVVVKPVEVAPEPVAQVTEPVQSVQATPITPVVEPIIEQIETPNKNFCTGCGENLIDTVSYCYVCGQKVH